MYNYSKTLFLIQGVGYKGKMGKTFFIFSIVKTSDLYGFLGANRNEWFIILLYLWLMLPKTLKKIVCLERVVQI